MSGRRGFFAFVGNAAVTGLVTLRASAAAPTLILPSADASRSTMPAAGRFPQLDRRASLMNAFLDVKQGVPDVLFLDWLEGGLRSVESCKPGGSIFRAAEIDRAAGRDPWRDWT